MKPSTRRILDAAKELADEKRAAGWTRADFAEALGTMFGQEEMEMSTQNVKVLPFSRDLVIRNIDALPRGLNLRYLVVIASHVAGEYIAKRWARLPSSRPVEGEIFLDMKAKR